MGCVAEFLLFLLLAVVPAIHCIPQNGNYEGVNLTFTVGSTNNTKVCPSLAMQAHKPIRITLDKVSIDKGEKLNVTITSRLYYSDCALMDHGVECGYSTDPSHLVANNSIEDLEIFTEPNFHYHFLSNYTTEIPKEGDKNDDADGDEKGDGTDGDKNSDGTDGDKNANGADSTKGSSQKAEPKQRTVRVTTSGNVTNENGSADSNQTGAVENVVVVEPVENVLTVHHFNESFPPDWTTFTTPGSAVYIVVVEAGLRNGADAHGLEGANITLTFHIEMKNGYGYLSLVDYPTLVVFSLLLVVYVFYAFLWFGMMACYYKDIVRLQFWVAGVILLGFLEKVFFVSEYSTANQGQESWGLIYIAEGVSATKRALSRMLIIIVCEGFGTVKPRLGSTLPKVLAVGMLYFVMAFVDGIVRATKVTTESHDLTAILTFAMLVLIDTGIIYWVFSALVNTRRILRLRKNLVKLSVYNHLAYALLFTCAASLAFVFWEAFEISSSECTADWKELWLMDCYWHILFCIILFVIMMIWRPSANKLRFAYALVSSEADDEEVEQGANKNFETVKMRQVNRLDSKVTSAEAEEDLKWVEENLPTTAIDKALPLVLDTDEEVMTTSFEVSKMN